MEPPLDLSVRRAVAGKARVHELAKELGVTSKQLLETLKEQGEFVKSASSTVEAPVARRLRESLAPKSGPASGNGGAKAGAKSTPKSSARPAASTASSAPAASSVSSAPASPSASSP